MKGRVLKTLRERLLVSTLGTLIAMVFLAIWPLYTTTRMYAATNRRFKQQQSLREIQKRLEEFQTPLLSYLSTRSSDALASLLIMSQKIGSSIPQDELVPSDPILLAEKEVYSMLRSYLTLTDLAIEERRGMNIARYTSIYNEMQTLMEYINERIEHISSRRFSAQLEEYDFFFLASQHILALNIIFIISTSLFTLVSIWNTINSVNSPITNLSLAAVELSDGKFNSPDIKHTGISELDKLISAFNRMKSDIHSYIEELRWQRHVEQEYMQERVRNMNMAEVLRTMELYTLQAQMNPHFLFNTLNTGIQLAIIENAERTAEYMEDLSRLLRHNMSQKEAKTSLKKEIEGLQSYFSILKVRFSQSLDLMLDCPDELLDATEVPTSILQPLVENCIIHAFKTDTRRHTVLVRAVSNKSILELSVQDNGSGMSAEKIKELLSPNSRDEHFHKVMGLENVIQRLRFFYPDREDVIDIVSREGEGTSICIRIPEGVEICTAS